MRRNYFPHFTFIVLSECAICLFVLKLF